MPRIRSQEDYEIVREIVQEVIRYDHFEYIDLLKAWAIEASLLSDEGLEEELQRLNDEMNELYHFYAHEQNGMEYNDDEAILITFHIAIIERIIERRRKIQRDVIEEKPDKPKPHRRRTVSSIKKPPRIRIREKNGKPQIVVTRDNSGPGVVLPSNIPDDIPKDEVDEIISDLVDGEQKDTNVPFRSSRVTRRYKNNIGAVLAGLALSTSLVAGLVPAPVYSRTTSHTSRTDVDYTAHSIVETTESEEDALNRAQSDLEIGGSVYVEDGDTFNTNSQQVGKNKTIGEEFDNENKYEGEYRITGFSIIKDGEIVEYIEDFDGVMTGPRLEDFVNSVCEEHNLSVDDIEVKIHCGSNPDITRLGWIDVTDLVTVDDLSQEDFRTTTQRGITYSGTIHDFEGDIITLSNGVTININGHSAGDRVIGSDGEEYVIDTLDFSQIQKTQSTQTQTGTTIKFDVSRAIPAALIPLLAALFSEKIVKDKNKKAELNPELFDFESDEQYSKFKEMFEKGKKEEPTTLKEKVDDILFPSNDVLRDLTPDQRQEINNQVLEHQKEVEKYLSDKYGLVLGEGNFDIKDVKLTNGRIMYATYDDLGHLMGIYDITDLMLPYVSGIGKDNNVISEGNLTDEIRMTF